MAEKIVINGFRYGLDGRRSELTSQPGTLVTAKNGFVNQGSEFEKRKAFVKLGTLPTGCFGLQETKDGLVTFGSASASIHVVRKQGNGDGTATVWFAYNGGSSLVSNTHAYDPSDNDYAPYITSSYAVGSKIDVSGFADTRYNGTARTITAYTGNANEVKMTYQTLTSFTDAGNDEFDGVIAYPAASTLFAGLTYQRLRHPLFDLFEGLALPYINFTQGRLYNPTFVGSVEPYMNGVPFSRFFGGKVFASATFPSNTTYVETDGLYFNQKVVGDYVWGRKFFVDQTNSIASFTFELQANVQLKLNDILSSTGVNTGNLRQSYYLGQPDQDFTGVFRLYSPNTDLDDPSLDPAYALQSSSTGVIEAVSAVSTFYITHWENGGTIKLSVPDGSTGSLSGTIDLSSAIAFSQSALVSAQDMANAANANPNNQGYTITVKDMTDQGYKNVVQITVTAPTAYSGLITTSDNVTVTLVNGGTDIKINTDPTANKQMAGSSPFSIPFVAGTAASGGAGQSSTVTFSAFTFNDLGFGTGMSWGGTFVYNDIEYDVGASSLRFATPTFALPLGNKMYICNGNQVNFCSLSDPTKWETQDLGAGFIQVQDFYSSPTGALSMAWYQGRLAIFGRWATQIWAVNADPAQYSVSQTLQNIGTFAPLSPQSLGDLDVLFLSDTGIRSLRVRDSSLNAYVVDIGSPVDSFVLADILAAADATKACAVVDPTTNNYWLFLNDKIYVLSYYPTMKITAFSTFEPTYEVQDDESTVSPGGDQKTFDIGDFATGSVYKFYSGGGGLAITFDDGTTKTIDELASFEFTDNITAIVATAASLTNECIEIVTETFTPVKFCVLQGKIYVLADNGDVFVYGGTDGQTYDGCEVEIELPWMDNKTPDYVKNGVRIDSAHMGDWQIEYAMDPKSTTGLQVLKPFDYLSDAGDVLRDSTFDNGEYSTSAFKGTHLKARLTSRKGWPFLAVFSALTFQFSRGNQA